MTIGNWRAMGGLLCLAFAPALAGLSACAGTVDGSAPVYYFSDCQSGAAPDCVPGKNSNRGTQSDAPKQNLSGFDVNGLPAGSQLLFARGGAWANFVIRPLSNLNVTPAKPLVFDAYGSGAAPLLRTANGTAIEFGRWQDTTLDGGYTLRNLKLDGQGTAQWGLWLRGNLRNLTLENVEITGFSIAIHSQPTAPHGITGTVLRNSLIHRNRDMGLLGKYTGAVIEGNTFEANNFSGSPMSHAIYLSGNEHGGSNGVLRNNRFVGNSVASSGPNAGKCTGGNVTAHGQLSGWMIEGNLILQTASTGGCYGFSLTPGYNSPEWFRNFVVRGNTIVNTGGCAICVGAAPGIVVEGNTVIQTQATPHRAIQIPVNVEPGGPLSVGDDVDNRAIVRDNMIYFSQPHPNSTGVSLGAGAGATTQSNNLTVTSADALLEVPSAANGWRCRVAARVTVYGSCNR